jgi:hypothetical protein
MEVVTFKSQPFFPRYPLDMKLSGSQNWVWVLLSRKIKLYPAVNLTPVFQSYPIAILTEPSGSS